MARANHELCISFKPGNEMYLLLVVLRYIMKRIAVDIPKCKLTDSCMHFHVN